MKVTDARWVYPGMQKKFRSICTEAAVARETLRVVTGRARKFTGEKGSIQGSLPFFNTKKSQGPATQPGRWKLGQHKVHSM